MPFESSKNVSLGTSLGNARMPGVPPKGLSSYALMPWLWSRWVIILGPFGVLQAHVVDGTPFGRYRPIRILLRDASQWALGDSRALQYLFETGNGRVYEQHGPISCILPGLFHQFVLVPMHGTMIVGFHSDRKIAPAAGNSAL